MRKVIIEPSVPPTIHLCVFQTIWTVATVTMEDMLIESIHISISTQLVSLKLYNELKIIREYVRTHNKHYIFICRIEQQRQPPQVERAKDI